MTAFLQVTLAIVAVLLFSPNSLLSADDATQGKDVAKLKSRLPMLQLAAAAHEAQIKVLVERGKSYQYQLLAGDNKTVQPVSIAALGWGNSPHIIHHLSFSGLQARHQYILQVKDPTTAKLLDSRTLQTLSLADGGKSVRFAVASCMYDKYEEQRSVWSVLAAQKPDLILMIGDNVYADKDIAGESFTRGQGKQAYTQEIATPAELWRRYAETRKTLAIFHNEHLIPVHAVWDDHDYGMNNGDRTYPYKHQAKAIFKTFFHGHATAGVHMSGLGVGSYLRLGDFGFFMLDNRFFRSPNANAHTGKVARTAAGDAAHFGEQQLAWLRNHLRGRKHAFLFAGNQWFADYHRFESFANNHPNRLQHFIAKLKTVPTKLLFFSGDRHLSEIMALPASQYLGYQTYEFTSSPIHAKVYPSDWDKTPNKLQQRGVSEQYNFLLLNAALTKDAKDKEAKGNGYDNKLTINTSAMNHKGETLFTHAAHIDF